MNAAVPPVPARPAPSWPAWTAGAVIVLAALAAYHNSLTGPFTFDDAGSILENATIRHLWPPGPALSPPFAGGETVGGRPVLNFSLALNYAISGTRVWSYHALNALIHALAGLALFGVVRRTLLQLAAAREGGAFQSGALPEPTAFAFAVALLWTVHPLQTEAVTYTIQRAESLMGLWYLLTFYCFVRGAAARLRLPAASEAVADSGHAGRNSAAWFLLSFLCCLLGMATKEVMVTAPVMVPLYDRTFLSGTFREAWRRSRLGYLALGSTWLLLGALMLGTHNRGGSIGYGNGVPWWAYTLTQFPALARYLQLSVWPRPLVFDYGIVWIRSAGEVVPAAIAILLLAALAAWACIRPASLAWRTAGFLGAWFFVILAPTSSVVPGTTQMIVEHRVYLSLAAVMVLVALGLHALAGRIAARPVRTRVMLGLAVPLALAWCALTIRRNEIYRDGLTLWQDTVAKRPEAARPHNYLGAVLYGQDRIPEALAEYQLASRLDPGFAPAHNGLGTVLLKTGHLDEALAQYGQAVQEAPGYAEAQYNFGLALLAADRPAEAAMHEGIALHQRPEYPDALNTLGNALFRLGRPADAVTNYAAAVRLRPEDAQFRNNLGIALAHAGNLRAAVAQLQEAVRLSPGDAALRNNLGRVQAVLDGGGP
jgi:Flp pilus assembly protein TadD